jgi:hypothetical protein
MPPFNPCILSDRNSMVVIDPASQAGMSSWTVDGVEHLRQQWFWYRVGTTPEASIDTLTLTNATASNANGRQGDEILTLNYSGSGFELQIKYSLVGGTLGSRASGLSEQIMVTNTSFGPLDFHLFQYTDLDLNGSQVDGLAMRTNANAVRQSDLSAVFSEVVVTPAPTHFEIALLSTTVDKLNDEVPTTLTDAATGLGPGNSAWAFEWDRSLAATGRGRSLLISENMSLNAVPEPATLTLLGSGLAAAGILRRLARRRQQW